MSSSRRFTVVDMAAGFVLFIVIGSVVQSLPGCGLSDARRSAIRMQNTTHVRGIHSGCIFFAQQNSDYFPGFDGSGAEAIGPLPDGPTEVTTRANSGYDPAYRFALLLRMGMVSPEYLISPAEEKGNKVLVAPGGIVSSANFSYAMLRISDPAAKSRNNQWRATNSSSVPVITDRNIGPGAGGAAVSIHEKKWAGSVCYNDNHAVFEPSNVIQTDFKGVFNKKTFADDLFADDKDVTGQMGNDAAMVYQDATAYVNQK